MIVKQVTSIFFKKNIVNQCVRFQCSQSLPQTKLLLPLGCKKLLKISGVDAPAFLQGLITNDVRHFEDGAKSMYAMFLNNKGRVLYDTLIHRWEGEDSFMLECDKEVIKPLERHLKIYKLKRYVNIEDVNHLYKLWVLLAPPKSVPDIKIDTQSSINIYRDPRLVDLGFRLLTSAHMGAPQIVEMIGKDLTVCDDESEYKYLRYKLGVSEGFEDLPPGVRFPLEANCDYLHGVSFHKGCYIGQELLARVYYTGVIRKRIMPLKFNDMNNKHIPRDALIVSSENPRLTVGKLAGCEKDHGIGLLRLKEALEVKELSIVDRTAEVIKPLWWPLEAPKEKISVTKTEKE